MLQLIVVLLLKIILGNEISKKKIRDTKKMSKKFVKMQLIRASDRRTTLSQN